MNRHFGTVDIMGIDILGIDILGIDIEALPRHKVGLHVCLCLSVLFIKTHGRKFQDWT